MEIKRKNIAQTKAYRQIYSVRSAEKSVHFTNDQFKWTKSALQITRNPEHNADALVMGDGALCYGALEIVGLLLLLLLLTQLSKLFMHILPQSPTSIT